VQRDGDAALLDGRGRQRAAGGAWRTNETADDTTPFDRRAEHADLAQPSSGKCGREAKNVVGHRTWEAQEVVTESSTSDFPDGSGDASQRLDRASRIGRLVEDHLPSRSRQRPCHRVGRLGEDREPGGCETFKSTSPTAAGSVEQP